MIGVLGGLVLASVSFGALVVWVRWGLADIRRLHCDEVVTAVYDAARDARVIARAEILAQAPAPRALSPIGLLRAPAELTRATPGRVRNT